MNMPRDNSYLGRQFTQANTVIDFVEAGPAASPRLVNVFDINARGAQEEGQRMELTNAGSGKQLSFFTAAATILRDQLQNEEEEKKRREETTFQQLLDQMDARIAALEAQIEDYDRQIQERNREIQAVDALIALERLDHLDPANPEHQRLLRLAGYNDPDQWGTLTQDDFERRRRELQTEKDDLERRRDRARRDLDDARDDRADLERLRDEAVASGGRVNVRSAIPAEDIAALQSRNAEFNPEQANAGDLAELLDMGLERNLLQRDETMGDERTWFIDRLESIAHLEGTPQHTQLVDRLIDSLSEETREQLRTLEDQSQIVSERLARASFDEIYESLRSTRAQPGYEDELSLQLEFLSEGDRAMLLRQNDLPADARRLLEAMQPSSEPAAQPNTTPI